MKAWQLLQALSADKQEQLIHWLKGELQEKEPDFLSILHVFLKMDKEPPKKEVWAQCFPQKPFDDDRYRRITHNLKSHLELFLAYIALKEDPDLKKVLYLKQLNQLTLPTLFEKEVKKILNDLKKNKVPSSSYYQMLYRIQKEIQYHNLQHKSKNKKSPLQEFSLNHYFDPWWIHEKFLMACSDDTLHNIYGSHSFTPLLKEAEETVKAHPEYEQMKYLHMMIQLLNMDESYDPKKLYALFEELAFQREGLEVEESTNLYSYFLNRTSRLFNKQGSPPWALLLFKLYKWGIDHKYLIHKKVLPPANLRAVVHVGLIAGQLEEVASIIPIYGEMVLPIYRGAITDLCNAKLAFYQGDMRKTCKLLVDKKFTDKFLDFESRLLILQATYEQNTDSPTEMEVPIQSLQRYIRYQEYVSDIYKTRFLVCLKLFLQMIKTTDRDTLNKLKLELESCEVLGFKLWLKDKIEDLLGNQMVYST